MTNENFEKIIKENTDFKPETSKAEFENLKAYIQRRNVFFNPFLPFLISSALLVVFTFILISKNTIEPAPKISEDIAVDYLFESYFAIEDDLESIKTDEDLSI